jgi:flotillin
MSAVPPMNDLFNMAGMKLPDYLGKEKQPADERAQVIKEDESENLNSKSGNKDLK